MKPLVESGTNTGLGELKKKIGAIEWYHTIDLGDGIVTEGVFDHSKVLSKYPLPERLDGLRVLDIATFDGYFAFEMERRGAKEVVALDVPCAAELDMPRMRRLALTEAQLTAPFGDGFRLAHERLGSKVQRVEMNVYDLSPERLGMFDVVHLGSLLLHLKNPIKALENMRSVTKDLAVVADCYSPKLPLKIMRYLGGHDNCAWWSMSLGCLKQMIVDVGFSSVELKSKYSVMHRTSGKPINHASFVARV